MARNSLGHLKPDVLILAEDNVSFPTGLFIKAARNAGTASIVIPYTLANTKEFVEGFRGDRAHSTRRLYNGLVSKLFPQWCHNEQDEGILRLPGHHVLAMELLGAAPDRPWIPNNGHWDAFAVESPRMQQRYLKEFAMPAERLVLTGAMSDDSLHQAKRDAAELKRNVYRELGLPAGRPMVLVAFPPNQFSRRHPDLEFDDYQSMTRFLVESLKTLTDCNVVFSLHPRIDSETRAYIEALGAKICARDTLELVAACDVYVASVSATIRWAIVCNVPVINYDMYQYRYDDYVNTPGVHTVQTKNEWLGLLRELKRKPEWSSGHSTNPHSSAASWGLADGRSGWRLVKLFDTLADRSRRLN